MITSIKEYKKILEANNVEVFIMHNNEMQQELQNDNSINSRIRFFYINDIYDKNKQFFVVLKYNNKVIGISRVAYFSMSSKNQNDLSISYFSIDKNYRYLGYSKLMLDKLFQHAKENNYTISTSSYTVLGKLQLQKLIHEYANKYNVEIIDKDSMLDTEHSYVMKDDKLYHKNEINEAKVNGVDLFVINMYNIESNEPTEEGKEVKQTDEEKELEKFLEDYPRVFVFNDSPYKFKNQTRHFNVPKERELTVNDVPYYFPKSMHQTVIKRLEDIPNEGDVFETMYGDYFIYVDVGQWFYIDREISNLLNDIKRKKRQIHIIGTVNKDMKNMYYTIKNLNIDVEIKKDFIKR